jgi:hypothetical protein
MNKHTHQRNPKTVKEALSSPEYSQWVDAIQAEMSSLHNRVDDLLVSSLTQDLSWSTRKQNAP